MFFKRGEKRKEMCLVLRDAAGGAVFSDNPSALTLEEKTMLRLSERFFNDPAPCVIHRTAVIHRVAMELSEMLSDGAEHLIGDLPGEAAEYLSKYDAVSATLKNS